MNHETGPHHTKVVAELGLAGLGLAAAGYIVYRRHHSAQFPEINQTTESAYRQHLAILDEAKVERKLANGRHIMAAAAVRIFYASHSSAEQVITKTNLWHALQGSVDETLHITKHQLQDALGFLGDHELIGRRPHAENPKSQGYYALPALDWVMQHGDKPPRLAEAETEFLGEQF